MEKCKCGKGTEDVLCDNCWPEEIDEMIEDVYEAQEKLEKVIGILEDVIDKMDDLGIGSYSYRVYLLDKLSIFLNNDHGFLCNDKNLENLIEDLEEAK